MPDLTAKKNITEQVILVNERDVVQGEMEKMEAHQKGLLHRAFSVFIFNNAGELLLQQRALDKYHSGGLWTNTCCSHPRLAESNLAAANRRLKEEMGMVCELQYGFHFIYKAVFEDGLTEHELDHVFFGVSDATPKIDPDEVAAFRYVGIEQLQDDINKHPEQYTPWFKICLSRVTEAAQSL